MWFKGFQIRVILLKFMLPFFSLPSLPSLPPSLFFPPKGRPFPSLTASSASRNLAPATTTVTTTKHTNSNKCPPSMTSTTSSMMSSNRSGCVEPSDEEEEEETEGRDDSPEASWRPIPDDAQFPKNGTGRLFFADCLSSKNKYRDDMI